MSLADELKAASIHRESTEEWWTQWRATLPAADRKTVDDWLTNPLKPMSTLYRVCKNHGYTGGERTFREFVRQQRDNR